MIYNEEKTKYMEKNTNKKNIAKMIIKTLFFAFIGICFYFIVYNKIHINGRVKNKSLS